MPDEPRTDELPDVNRRWLRPHDPPSAAPPARTRWERTAWQSVGRWDASATTVAVVLGALFLPARALA